MKLFVLPAGEDWVCDRFVAEWRRWNEATVVDDPNDADIIWALAGWCWNHIPVDVLSRKKLVVTVHHIDPLKFDERSAHEFKYRDQFVDVYHVPCPRTATLVSQLTTRPIFIRPFWVNSLIWTPLDKSECRQKHGLSCDKYLLGSFQRDTEGHDLRSPKLAKGPDVVADVIESFHKVRGGDVEVVLAGWRRQYIMRRLDDAGITYHYFERPNIDVINELYNALDLYVVGSRYEGGPQAIFECAATFTPIISTPVGFAEEILGQLSIENPSIYEIVEGGDYSHVVKNVMKKRLDVDSNFERIQEFMIPDGFQPFLSLFKRLNS